MIFDEASQVRPHEAISAIYRGRQLVVAGDENQLPPTNFFTRMGGGDDLPSGEDDEVEDELADFESILGVCSTLGLPRRRLRWHYRSRREPLIAFSNRHIYDSELVTFPSVHDTGLGQAILFEQVTEGRWKSGTSGGFNAVEARRVAELVVEHCRSHADRSLGVIAFSQRQQVAILDELEQLRAADPSCEAFFSETAMESFFVKNLENVQGDERDVIILSVGYGPDESGRLRMHFGPLNLKGGERRLNVAITRSRMAMTVVSSLRARDIDLSRTSAAGARLLRSYLDYAERGVEALGAELTEANGRDFDSPFEREVAKALEARGLTVHRQVGCGGFRIDLALTAPREAGRYVLGIECDGATYHSSATARDRDRLRQEILESLGWRICRVWSADWVRDPVSQVDRIVTAFDAAVRQRPQVKARPASQRDEMPEPVQVSMKLGDKGSTVRLATPSFRSIDEVPSTTIRELLTENLTKFGATGEADIGQTIARRLGFQRTGAKIKSRIENEIDRLVREGLVTRDDSGVLRVVPGRVAKRG